jgi:predicted transcriptional regulator
MGVEEGDGDSTLLERQLATRIVAAYVANHAVSATELGALIHGVRTALRDVASPSDVEPARRSDPLVSIKRSITPDHLVCLEDGRKLKTLKRHLRTIHDMSVAEYRAKWQLPADYPTSAPNYARRRAEVARQVGLGHRKVAPPAPAARSRAKRRRVVTEAGART